MIFLNKIGHAGDIFFRKWIKPLLDIGRRKRFSFLDNFDILA